MTFKTIAGKKVNIDTSGTPPKHLINDDRLTELDDRFYLVDEDMNLGTLAVDEYKKRAKDLFEFKRHILFSQTPEETTDLLDVTGGGKKSSTGGSLELKDEKSFIKGLDGAGALQLSNFGE